jgi:hypothetical protein
MHFGVPCPARGRKTLRQTGNYSQPGESLQTLRQYPSSAHLTEQTPMVTCYLRYIVDPYKLKEFEHYGKLWIPLVEKFGGQHHGYFLPSEGANDVALAMFTFPSLAAYEKYRADSMQDPECQAAFKYAEETRCILSYERSFFRPVFK